MDLFKGYIKSKGKVPTSAIKTGEHLTNPPENSDYVGILKPNIIQLDFDNSDDARIALQIVQDNRMRCDVLQTTRGVHLYFINDNSITKQCVAAFNAIGLRCDVGLGAKDRVIPLRITKEIESKKIVNGEELYYKTKQVIDRQWLQTYDELDVIPDCFKIVGRYDFDFKNCTSRNQTLFSYILKLQTQGFDRSSIRTILELINKYIFPTPLSEKELNMITREDAFSQELFFDKDGKFIHNRFGNYMLSNSNILSIDNQIHIYTGNGIYLNDPCEFEKVMINKIPSLKESQRKEVYKYMNLKCEKKGEFAPPQYVALSDNIIDISNMECFDYSPNWVINNKIGYNYNENAYNELMDKTLDKVCCHDKQIRMLLEEMIGYTLYRKNSMQVCFILTGEGSNGKSTILNCIKKLLGKQNYTSLDLRELEETFKPAELYNKLANIGDDISAKYLENSSVFKKCVTGESFIVQKKYAQPFELESYATQIFCANELPQVKDKSDGFSRRIVIVPFNARFTKDDEGYDPFVEIKLLKDESIEYLLKLAINGLRRVIMNNKFTKSDQSEREKDVYIRSNNNVLEWLDDCEVQIENNAVSEIFKIYQVWCATNGYQPVKKLNFSKEVKKKLGLSSKPKSIDGKTVRVYVKEID